MQDLELELRRGREVLMTLEWAADDGDVEHIAHQLSEWMWRCQEVLKWALRFRPTATVEVVSEEIPGGSLRLHLKVGAKDA